MNDKQAATTLMESFLNITLGFERDCQRLPATTRVIARYPD